jgi:hypothetical protein
VHSPKKISFEMSNPDLIGVCHVSARPAVLSQDDQIMRVSLTLLSVDLTYLPIAPRDESIARLFLEAVTGRWRGKEKLVPLDWIPNQSED